MCNLVMQLRSYWDSKHIALKTSNINQMKDIKAASSVLELRVVSENIVCCWDKD